MRRYRVRRPTTEPLPVDGARWVALSKGKFALVDIDDFERINRLTWSFATVGYAVRDSGGAHVMMHKFILDAADHQQVDHRNRDGLDNRRDNLRLSTHGQNQQNKKLQRNNTSGFKGVSFTKRRQLWRSEIVADGRRTIIGYYRDPYEAALMYDKAARELHGEFAFLNYPDES